MSTLPILSLLDRSHYPGLRDWVYLNQASLGLIGQPAVTAMHRFLDEIGRYGNLYMTDEDEVAFFESLRERGAKILGCQPDQLAILASASELLGQLPFMLRPAAGQEVVAVATDFPAVTRPWLRYATEHDCTVRFVADSPETDLTDALLAVIGEKTAVIAVSYVQFATGSKIDVPRLQQACAQVDARLIVDVTQAAGSLKIESDAWQAEAIVSSGYKWLGGHGGVALAAISQQLSDQVPPLPGWMGTPNPFDFEATKLAVAAGGRRFTQSTMAYASLAGLTAALDELLSLETGQIEAHAHALAHRLVAQVKTSGWKPFRPLDQPAAAPHIVMLAHPDHASLEAVVARLRTQRVVCGARNGRLRVSLAPYNNSNDVDALSTILAQERGV